MNGAVEFSQCVIREMLKNQEKGISGEGKGFLCFSGATAATKGSAKFAGFAPAKFALRGLGTFLLLSTLRKILVAKTHPPFDDVKLMFGFLTF